MTKENLLAELYHHSYAALKPSTVAGIGVFALVDIPAGCRNVFSKPDPPGTWVSLSFNEVENLPAHARWMVENYCLYDEQHYFVPAAGFKKMDLSFYLNHSDTPNLISIDEGDYFETTRDIAAGEELLIDYGTIAG